MDEIFFERYIIAGNAIFTLSSTNPYQEKEYYTYKIKRTPYENLWAIYLLKGQDNEKDYEIIGNLSLTIGGDIQIHNPHNWEMDRKDKAIRLLRLALYDSREVNFYKSKYCAKCGRRLTTPESISFGIGPKCRG